VIAETCGVASGHCGRLCSACIEGHTIQGQYCLPCDATVSPAVKKALGFAFTCVLVGLLVAWLSRPYFEEKEQKIARAISAKSLQIYRRLNSKYKKQISRQASNSKLSRGLDKAQSNIQRNIEIQVRCGQGSPSLSGVLCVLKQCWAITKCLAEAEGGSDSSKPATKRASNRCVAGSNLYIRRADGDEVSLHAGPPRWGGHRGG
jgi:hypothetical protein